MSARSIKRILDRNYDGKPRWSGGQPFTDWIFPRHDAIDARSVYGPAFYSRSGSGKWCWDCTPEEADAIFPKVVEATQRGRFAACIRSLPCLAKQRDGFHLVLVFTTGSDRLELRRTLDHFRSLGATGEVFWKSDAMTKNNELGYEFSSHDIEFGMLGDGI